MRILGIGRYGSFMKPLLLCSLLAGSIVAMGAGPAFADTAVTFSTLFYNGGTIHTVVTPGEIPDQGTDPFYKVTDGAAGQLGIAGVAPGSGNYHGGAWEVFVVMFNPGFPHTLLTSAQAVLTAQSMGQVTVTRHPEQDFRCPVQP